MRIIAVFIALFALTVAWSKEEYEIFSVNDKVQADLGPTSFYAWLNVSRKAPYAEINKAYRRLLRKIHPDKYKGKQKREMELRYQTLSVVGNILRDNDLRQRYDYFLDRGFPKWKGTTYLYSRYRPGIVGTLIGLWLLASFVHYVGLKLNRLQDKKRLAAMRQQLVREATGGGFPTGEEARLTNLESGKTFVVRPDNLVFLETDDGLVEMNENAVRTAVSVRETLLFKLPAGLYNVTLGKVTGRRIDTTVDDSVAGDSTDGPAPKKKKKPKGKKVKLPNGKVVYSRKQE